MHAKVKRNTIRTMLDEPKDQIVLYFILVANHSNYSFPQSLTGGNIEASWHIAINSFILNLSNAHLK